MPLGMLGKYERLDVLGHGASGIVYLARDTLLNRQVALKEVDVHAGDIRKFLEEARVLDRLRHPNIVRVNGVDRIESRIVIDMEYVRGDNLQEVLRKQGRLPLKRAAAIAAQVLDALDYAHQKQTVHRDIKPANILLDKDGQVKLVDFGLAEILATNAYAGGAGTYAYMAPEDFAEDAHSDSQSDIWAAGVTLFEMAAGVRPFQASNLRDPFSWKRLLETETAPALESSIADSDAVIQAILDRALARDKRDRYPTAGEFRNDILDWLQGAPISRETTAFASARARTRGSTLQARTAFSPMVQAAENTGEELRTVAAAPESMVGRGRRSQSIASDLTVEPNAIDLGSIRKGERPAARITVRVKGASGPVAGRVLVRPGWLGVDPAQFDRARQVITVTGHSERIWQTGDFTDTVTVETLVGRTDVPVHVTILPARPGFWQIAPWFVPLFLSALFPALTAVMSSSHANAVAGLVPSAAIASALLYLMLLLVSAAADLGMAERAMCGILMASMCFVVGATISRPGMAHSIEVRHTGQIGALVAIAVIMQVSSFSKWKLWAGAILLLGPLLSALLLRLIAGH